MKDKIELSFYHFTSSPLAVGLPRLIKKIYESKQNLLVVCKTQSEMNELDRVLWSFSPKEFIPHGIAGQEDAELQPVLFAMNQSANQNSAEILLSSNGEVVDLNSSFKKYLYAFYGNSQEVKHMLDLYNEYKTRENINAIFWRQDQIGKWTKMDA
jgi:DNA polymerase-3 subunit chi